MAISKDHKGARGELLAAAWLLAHGLEIFRNMSSSGPADLVAWHIASRQTFLIDVKYRSRLDIRADGQLSVSVDRSRPPDVHVLFVTDVGVLGFYRHASDGSKEQYNPFTEAGLKGAL